MSYSLNDLSKHFSNDALEQAKACQSDLDIVKRSRMQNAVTAKVCGENDLFVSLKGIDAGELDYRCGCGVVDCSHALAALIIALPSEQNVSPKTTSSPQAIPASGNNFLNKIKQQTAAPVTDAQAHQCLEYRLTPTSASRWLDASRLQLSIAIRNVATRGNKETSVPFNVQMRQLAAPPRFMQDSDITILNALLDKDVAWQNQSEYTAIPDGDFMGMLLATERVYWEDSEQPLRLSTTSSQLDIAWQTNAMGTQSLHMQSHNSQAIVATDNLYAIMQSGDQCAVLEGGYTQAAMDEVRKEYRVEPQNVAAFIDQHQTAFSELGLPFPDALPIESLTEERPQPCLVLKTETAFDGRSPVVDVMQLTFRYPGKVEPIIHRWKPDTDSNGGADILARQMNDGVVYDIHRNAVYEQTQRLLLQHHIPMLQFRSRHVGFTVDITDEWKDIMLTQLPLLKEQGWQVEVEEGFRFHYANVNSWYGDVSPIGSAEQEEWLGVDIGIDVDGEQINLLPVLMNLVQQNHPSVSLSSLSMVDKDQRVSIMLDDGRIVALEAGRLATLLTVFVELAEKAKWHDNSLLKLPASQSMRLAELDMDAGMASDKADATDDASRPTIFSWKNASAINQPETLKSLLQPKLVTIPESFNATLRDYQLQGVAWMQAIRELELGGVLADDMGLGKTIQTLAHIAIEKDQGRLTQPALIVVPTSLLHNWKNEAKQFCPDLSCQLIYGSERKNLFDRIQKFDVLITSYNLVLRDLDFWSQQTLSYVVLDEAHYIKNHRSQVTRAIKSLNVDHRLALSGTPLENNLSELWSLFDFVMPGFLGNDTEFKREFRTPIEKHADVHRQAALLSRIRPYMLRRSKNEVVKELPPKTEIICPVPLPQVQRDVYETIRATSHKKVQAMVLEQGLQQSRIGMLDALLKLRQSCCDPRLLPEGLCPEDALTQSAKLDYLINMLKELHEEGRKVLVFSQFTSMLDIIARTLKEQHVDYVMLTGKTTNRDVVVDQFQNGDVPVFLISLKAGGVGLNLTAADTVIHYDPWWNPAAEQQATDRAYRIGQDKPVFVYKLIAENTVEEKINQLQQRKKSLSQSVYAVAENRDQNKIEETEILEMLSE